MKEDDAVQAESVKGGIAALLSNRRWMPWATLALAILNIPAVLHGHRLTELGAPGIDAIVGTETAVAAVRDFAIPIMSALIVATVAARALVTAARWYERKKERCPENMVKRCEMTSGKIEALADGVSLPAFVSGQIFVIAILAANLFSPVGDIILRLPLDSSNLPAFSICAAYLLYTFALDITYTVYTRRMADSRRLAAQIDRVLGDDD